MLSFLKQIRKVVNTKELVCIVIGNESCDLDSAVCAISLAYLLHKDKKVLHNNKNNSGANIFLPVLNVAREDYALKTEVKYLFNEYGINTEYLTFRSELQEEFLGRCDFILVDHHVSPFAARCLQVFDHRPKDENSQLPVSCQLHLEMVGSCATLIAEYFLKSPILSELCRSTLNMLRQTIILDTVNFSPAAARATPKDMLICEKLEQILGVATTSREGIFKNLTVARADVNELSAAHLLRKDLKILSNKAKNIVVAVPGFPLLVSEFLKKEGAIQAVHDFAQEHNCHIILLMGLKVSEDGSIKRELGLIDFKNCVIWERVRNSLLQDTNLNLKLRAWECGEFERACFYEQINVKVTRKHIMPKIKEIVEN